MKNKSLKPSKKLVLNSETLRNLTDDQLDAVAGGTCSVNQACAYKSVVVNCIKATICPG